MTEDKKSGATNDGSQEIKLFYDNNLEIVSQRWCCSGVTIIRCDSRGRKN